MQTMATVTVTRRVTLTVACPGEPEEAEARIRSFIGSSAGFVGRLDGKMSTDGGNAEMIRLEFDRVSEAEAHASDFQLEQAAM